MGHAAGDDRALERRGPRLLTQELAALVDQGRLASLEAKRLRQELTRQAAHVRDLLARHEPGARQLLQTLLVDRLGFTPFEENGIRGYRFEGQATSGGLLAGLGIATSGGVPDGIRRLVEAGISRGYQDRVTPLGRVFTIEVLVCPRWAGPRRILGAVTEPHALRRLLAALGLAPDPPPDTCLATRP